MTKKRLKISAFLMGFAILLAPFPLYISHADDSAASLCGPNDTQTVIVSDPSTTFFSFDTNSNTPAVPVVASKPSYWTANIDGASWLWTEDPITSKTSDPSQDIMENFERDFSVSGTVDSAFLEIASDGTFQVNLNADPNIVAVNSNDADYSATQVYAINPTWLMQGANSLYFMVVNTANPAAATDPSLNPAGFTYKLTVCTESQQ